MRRTTGVIFSFFLCSRTLIRSFSRFPVGSSTNLENDLIRVREHRKKLNITPVVRRIYTVASDHPDKTNYLYFTYGADKSYTPYKQRSEEHTSELQSRPHLVCRLLLEKKKTM